MKVVGWLPVLLALGLGVGLGWVVARLDREDPVPADHAAALRPSGRGGAARPPELRGTSDAYTPSPPGEAARSRRRRPVAGAPAADANLVEIIDDVGVIELVEWEVELEPEALEQRGWKALLTLYAMAGRLDDLLRVVPKALDAGLEPATALELFSLVPEAERVEALDRLRGAHADVAWDVAQLVDLYLGVGATERAVGILVPALEQGATAELATRLVAADAEQAARVLGVLQGAGHLTDDVLGAVGRTFAEQGHGVLALPFLTDALRRQPFDYGTLMSLSRVDLDQALSHAKTLTAEAGRARPESWRWLGELQLQAGDNEAAFAAYRESADLGLSAESLYGMMRADPARAHAVAAELTKGTTDDEMLGTAAKIAVRGGTPEAAMTTLLRAHRQDPSDHEWMSAMVILDPGRAAKELARTASDFEGDGADEVIGSYASALVASGRGPEAYEQFLRAHELDPSDWEWQQGLARSDPARALEILRARHESTGDEGDLLGAIGDAYAGLGNEAEARRHYELALAQDGGSEWLARLGHVDPGEAEHRLRGELDASPENADLWGYLGDVYVASGAEKKAREAYLRAHELNPQNLRWGIRLSQTGG